MAVNLATKYSDKIATAFTHASYVRDVYKRQHLYCWCDAE